MCTETIVVYTCGCFEVTELNCCNRTANRSRSHLIYAICDEPYASEIQMQINCIECEAAEPAQYAQREREQAGEQEDIYDASGKSGEEIQDDIESNPSGNDSDTGSGQSSTDSNGWDEPNEDQAVPEEIDQRLQRILFLDIQQTEDENHGASEESVASKGMDEVVRGLAHLDMNQNEDAHQESKANQNKTAREAQSLAEGSNAAVFRVVERPVNSEEDVVGDEWFDAREQWQD